MNTGSWAIHSIVRVAAADSVVAVVFADVVDGVPLIDFISVAIVVAIEHDVDGDNDDGGGGVAGDEERSQHLMARSKPS